MLEKSKAVMAAASTQELETARRIALRFLASSFEENLMAEDRAAATAAAHEEADDELWRRTVLGIVLGLRTAAAADQKASGR